MVEIIIKGISLGLLMAVLVGPVFFLLIQTSIHKGYIQAIYLALGISFSDATYIALIYFGFAQFASDPTIMKYMGIGGGILLIIFGIAMLFKKASERQKIELKIAKKHRLKYFLKGFSLNSINPSVFLFWIGSVGVITTQYNNNINQVSSFFGITVGTVFATDLLKIYLSKKISKVVSPTVILNVSRVSAVAMIGYGVKLLCF
jgi:threonine/homoserine/homoserine lactone efflux protein